MPELRKDPIVGRWVIIAPERAQRPSEYQRDEPKRSGGLCPFCPGHEQLTPPEVLAHREGGAANGPGWRVRVFPNRFPALRVEGQIEREGEGLYDRMSGIGAHEVVVESPDHSKAMPELSALELEGVLSAYQARMLDLRQDGRLRSILVFKNQGAAAGATLEHSHSQLIALPILPRHVQAEMAGARRYFDDKERCLFCDIVRQERRDGVRMVCENAEALAIEPWAPRGPFETWVLPKAHGSGYEDSGKAQIEGLADCLHQTLRRLDAALGRPAFNLMIHTGPLDERGLAFYHWHIEIMPILVRVGGFEWGSGFYINPTPPETAAEFLRKAVI
ncbi:MAG: galactose-1-phosphate uridylyltransferase [Myxococcales bacterium]